MSSSAGRCMARENMPRTPFPPVEWGSGAAAYVNRYRNAWPAALGNIVAAIEDAKRRRHRGGIWVPTGTCGRLIVPELPAPMAAPKFDWPKPQVGGREGGGGRQREGGSVEQSLAAAVELRSPAQLPCVQAARPSTTSFQPACLSLPA